MKRQYVLAFHIILAFILFFSFTACSILGEKTISGKYVNETNSQVYIEFDKKNTATLYFDNNSATYGRYEIDAKTNYLSILFFSGETNGLSLFMLHNNDKSISMIGTADDTSDTAISNTFIKEKGFWSKHWMKFTIGFLIFGAIALIYEKITGRELGDDIDSFGDRTVETKDKDSDKSENEKNIN